MDSTLHILWDDGERVFYRRHQPFEDGDHSVLLARPASEHPLPASVDRLNHEFGLKDELDSAWAVRPRELVHEGARRSLVLDDPGGEPLARLLGAPMEIGYFLRLAVGIAAALGKLHQRGLVHKDLKPTHILVNCNDGQARLTGFGLASRLLRERQAPEPPETIAGTLAYMAPEQTGRMNRSIDSRSDLYAFGVTLYQMLTGELPFAAADPMEWVHCHIARQPEPPNIRVETVPLVLSQIVMKLLAKTAEERYQTAGGVEHDLQHCLVDWERERRVHIFPMEQHDISDRLQIPEKLYGREHEVDTLAAAFDRIVISGAPEMVLVSGYSGIGKSSVVNELHKILVPPRGIFAAGKFDQYKRDVPYSTLVQAFRGLVRPLLGKPETELASWRDELLKTLEPNARLMTDLIPELKHIIGEPPPVPVLDGQQAQSRFMLVFRRFIGVFARPEHPLALFLDDLQWLDAATLDLLEDLLTGSELRHLMLVGAYRDNEVNDTHPLMVKLQAIAHTGARIAEITLAPLASGHIQQLIAEALRCGREHIEPLAQLVHDKTAGNPFFVVQFLHALVEEELLALDFDSMRWRWDRERIHAKGYTDNVVDLMVGKLTRLPAKTLNALEQLACLGNVVQIATLSATLGTPEAEVHAALWEAIRQELVEQSDGAYRFVHDRVHEAAYSLIPQASRAEIHLQIGRLLAQQTLPERREEAIFEIVGQLNRGAALVTSREEREQIAGFNLLAGQRAKASTAYASALTYLVTGVELLSDECWDHQHDLIFALELNRAECEFLTGQLLAADQRLMALSKRAATTVEKAFVACLHMDVYLVLDRSDLSVAVCLAFLAHVGIKWSPHPTDDEVQSEYEQIWAQLGHRTIEELVDLPLMEDAASLGTLEALSKLFAPAVQTDANLAALGICKAISLSIERGNCDASCVLYVSLGRVAALGFGGYEAACRFGQLGCDLVDRRGLKRFEAKTFLCFSVFTARWVKPVRICYELVDRAFTAANQIGDLSYGAYAGNCHNSDLIFAGEQLPDIQIEAQRGLAYAESVRFGVVIAMITAQLALIRMLRGLTSMFGCFDDEQFHEIRFEAYLSANPDHALAECWYWIRKMQGRYFAGDYTAAMYAKAKAQPLLWTSSAFFEEAEYHFYGALAELSFCDTLPADERKKHLEATAEHHRLHQLWAGNCPENFGSRAALIGAEIARIDGRVVDAEELYEQAICLAQESGFVHIEALAHELASHFYATRGFRKIARVYLQEARYGYLRWGAEGKVRQLEEHYPYLRTDEPALGPTTTIAAPVEHLDLATVIKVSQAASSDIVLERLIDMIMRTAIEQAGAERGLLILPDGSEQRIVAEATTSGDATQLRLCDVSVSAAMLPESVINHVLRTSESVFLDDAAAASPFARDTYIREHRSRSILCVPLMNQAKLAGTLYLENNLTARAFSPTRIAVLKLVASQAAISLVNARLYRDLAEREGKIRRLVDANIIGIFLWNAEGFILEANDAFLRMLGHERGDLVAGSLRWRDLTPPEWREFDERALAETAQTGRAKTYEKELIGKDGRRVPVMIGAATFEGGSNESVAFVLDLTERKEAEEKVRESERRYREVQAELAHANRVATMGQLSASIAHEVKQPITAIASYATAGVRWMTVKPRNLAEVRKAFDQIIVNSIRADDIVERTRAFFKKESPREDAIDINKTILELVAFMRGEVNKHGVDLMIERTDGLPHIYGDRVQLQQVMLNLIINALEAMDATNDGERTLLIRTGKTDAEELCVSVQDSGPGFAAGHLHSIFEAFFTTKPNGLGMGLSICRSIVESHGGRLWVTPNPVKGATFQFTLPTQRDARRSDGLPAPVDSK
ncbi:trifunctional serine/threonine-protein kinase/ATP-binding protein/sensor histidine kinase [Paraburkholderia sp. RL17-381-BIF-C]|uniref:trifunctional serine/threonine-protein kinase/ATP-binding protein/sensor histidine kinase n=1 Tax=Paraburkholderia sp. RL17-381-BIF-C TaxID=3031635 RepID=UPI0038BB2688